MTIKEFMYIKRIKNVDLARALGLDPSRISLCVNGITKFPKRVEPRACDVLGISVQELRSNAVRSKKADSIKTRANA